MSLIHIRPLVLRQDTELDSSLGQKKTNLKRCVLQHWLLKWIVWYKIAELWFLKICLNASVVKMPYFLHICATATESIQMSLKCHSIDSILTFSSSCFSLFRWGYTSSEAWSRANCHVINSANRYLTFGVILHPSPQETCSVQNRGANTKQMYHVLT